MRKIWKKALAYILAIVICVSTVNVPVYAQKDEKTEGMITEATALIEGNDVSGKNVLEDNTARIEDQMSNENWDQVTTEKIFEDENYKVTFSLSSFWETGYNANIKVENIGSDTIQNWYLAFDYNDQITNIWNAEIFADEENSYIIKNAGWNQDIEPGSSIEFGISGSQAFKGFPQNYEMIGTSQEVNAEDYSIEYHVDSDWGSGFTGSIKITNNTETTLEDWILEFDFARNITQIWGAQIVSVDEKHYILMNAGYNANISAGEQITIGFCGTDGIATDEPSEYKVLSTTLAVMEEEDDDNAIIDVTLDTDVDGVPDYIEEAFGMDISLADTDGDGLSDYDEIYKTCTDPIYTDTDEDGINDAQADTDNDGLSSLEELQLGTDATMTDTDNDGLSDYEEVLKYCSNPLVVDTDGDYVSDGREIELGTDLLVKNDTFQVKLDTGNEDTVKVYVDVELQGSQVESLSVERYEDEFLFPEFMPGYIGGCYDFYVEGSFDKAVINFEFDSSLLADSQFEPAIYYFNESEQKLELMDTTVSGNVASATVTHFSKYILLNRTVYEDSFTWQDVWDYAGYTGVEIVLVIDDSGSLGGDYGYDSSKGVFTGGEDPEHKRLEVARNFVDNANAATRIGIVKFDGVIDNITGELIECNQDGKEILKNYLQFTYISGGNYNINGILILVDTHTCMVESKKQWNSFRIIQITH